MRREDWENGNQRDKGEGGKMRDKRGKVEERERGFMRGGIWR